ncbi:Vesicle coat complex COPII, subunit SFB3 [Trachipleistophora hominis]|uniref:Vesicle coat complex COPII, subunit SFB3 n=1 Tax=Trachipleistophora hominis TaxID=72359 RepID=L7JSN8_TRAHO|nr:Vesicle coat complex COPII, subunit SFB3 [Trachipleistophora hominis]
MSTSKSSFPSTPKSKSSPINSPSLPEELFNDQHNTSKLPPLSTTDTLLQPLIRSTMSVVPNNTGLFERVGVPLMLVIQPRIMNVCVERESLVRCSQCTSYVCEYTKTEGSTFYCNICGAKNRTENEITDLENTLILEMGEEAIDVENELGEGEMTSKHFFNGRGKHSVLLLCLECTNATYYQQCVNALESIFTGDEPFNTATHVLFFVFSDTLRVPYLKNGVYYEKILLDNKIFLDTSVMVPIDRIDAHFMARLRAIRSKGKSVLALPLALIAHFSRLVEFTKVLLFTRENVMSESDYSTLIDDFMENRVVLNLFGVKGVVESPLNRIVVSTNGRSYLSRNDVMERNGLKSANSSYGGSVLSSKLGTSSTGLIGDLSKIRIGTNVHDNVAYNTESNDMSNDNSESNTPRNVYDTERDEAHRLIKNIRECVDETVMYDVKCEVKTSDYVRRNNIYANSAEEMAMSFPIVHMTDRCTISYTFYVDGMLEGPVYVQCVLYYRDISDFKKKALIMNLKLKTSDNYSSIYNHLSMDTIFAYYVKVMASEIGRMEENKKFVMGNLVRTLRTYRMSTQGSQENHLVLPESIKNLPVLVSALFKNRDFSTMVSLFKVRTISNWPVRDIVRYFYPRMFSLDAFYDKRDLKDIMCTRLQYEQLHDGEGYVIENGQVVFFYLLKMVEQKGDERELEELIASFVSEEKEMIENLKEQIDTYYGRELLVRFVRNDSEILGMMVEDRIGENKCYNEFLCEIHYKIRS